MLSVPNKEQNHQTTGPHKFSSSQSAEKNTNLSRGEIAVKGHYANLAIQEPATLRVSSIKLHII